MKQRIIILLSAVGLALVFSLGLLFIPFVMAAGGSVTHTTQADFSQSCAVLTGTIPNPLLANVQVSNLNGGEVLLAPIFFDDFNGTTLNTSLWQSGNWSGSNTPLVSSSILTVPTATFVRSTSTFTQGIMEAVAEFGSGDFQHIGFVEDDLFSKYFMFSTYNTTDTLHARVFYGGDSFEAIPVGSIPTGLHTYRIEWDTPNAGVRFYVDNTLVHTSTIITPTPSLYLYLSNNDSAADGISADLRIDRVQVEPPYVSSGSYTSCALDAGLGNAWQTINWDAVLSSSTNLTVETQVSLDGVTWSGWASVSNGGALNSSVARYAQYRLNLATSDPLTTTLVNSVTLNYDRPPAGVTITPSGGSTNVSENGATDTYQVKLASQPISTVTINITPDAQVTVAPSSLDFNALTWDTPQTVIVTAINDTAQESSPHSGVITHATTSADSNYNNISVASVTANITDNDTPDYKVFLPIVLR